LAILGHPSKFERVSPVGSVTARHSSNGRQPNFAALNRGRHLYSALRPSRWALAYILVNYCFSKQFTAKFAGERILKIVSRVRAKNRVAPFFQTRCRQNHALALSFFHAPSDSMGKDHCEMIISWSQHICSSCFL